MILYGIGSPIVVDVEESLYRANLSLVAGIANHPGPAHLPEGARILVPSDLSVEERDLPFLVPLFTPGHRQAAAREAARHGLSRPLTLIDPSVAAPRHLEMGPGSYVNAGCSLGSGSVFGAFVFINRGASLGHHVRSGEYVSVGPGAVLAGHVSLGTGAFVGAGATILPEVAIGANAVVGAGSVVTKDVPDGCLALGNPARIVRQNIGGYRGLAIL
ncbi:MULTISPECIES: DapH/DapD/GlmU-related protein [unclassified Methylobacterium]|uniref:DapH/DapD/GlmU-related protein n=1 Tax=unclassified Methylobacterium TaxID=2615210 RepID=UPI001FEEE28E|nr:MULTISPECIES: DapH/DapD/GlmU-related protein [unclassified Methylobacterium]